MVKETSVKLFISYSHKDEMYREALDSHLSLLKREKVIDSWHDRKLVGGQHWKTEISQNLNNADIVIVLISSDFIASDYCFENEMLTALERHEQNISFLIPVIIRPTDWSSAPFSKIQALPKDAIPISKWESADDAWLNVVKGIREVAGLVRENQSRKWMKSGLQDMSSLLSKAVDRLDVALNTEETSNCGGISTGISDLDQITDGFHSGEVFLIAGRPETNVSHFALQVAKDSSINRNIPTALFSLRYTASKAVQILLAQAGMVDHYRLVRGSLEDSDWSGLALAVTALDDAKLFLDEDPSSSVQEILSKCQKINEDHELGLIVIDTLQHLTVQNAHPRNHSEVSELSKDIARLAKKLDVPVIVTSTVSADLEKRFNKRPMMQDLGAWRGVEEQMDTIVFLYLEAAYQPDADNWGKTEFLVMKNVNGPIGVAHAIYMSKYLTFRGL